MKNCSLKRVIPMLILLLMFVTPFHVVHAVESEDEQVPYPSIDKGDESDDIQSGSEEPGQSSEFDLPDYGAGLDEILGSQDSSQGSDQKKSNHGLEVKPGDDESNNPIHAPENSIDDSEKNDDESTAPKKNDKNDGKDKGAYDVAKGIWDAINNTAGPAFGLVNSLDGLDSTEGNMKLGRNLAKIPVSLLKPNMSDGQEAASDLGLFGVEATEDGIKWAKRFRDAESRAKLAQQYPNLLNGLSKGKDALSRIKFSTANMVAIGKDTVKTNSTAIYAAAKGKELVNGGKDFLFKGNSLLANTFSKGKDLLSKGSSFLSGPLSKGSELFSSVVSKGKDLLSGPLSKGKNLLTKGSNLLTSTFSKGKDLLSKGSSLLSGPLSKSKELFNGAVSKGKDLLSQGKNLLSGPLSKGKDLLSKGSGLITDVVSKGKNLGKTVMNSKAFSVAKNFATKGAGVLSAVGAVFDGFDAVKNFSAGNHLDGVGNTLGAIGGTVAAVSMFTPVGPIVATAGLVATGASLVIKHRKAIAKGFKKAKDTVVSAAKSVGNKVKNGFKSLGKGIGGLLGG